MTETHIQVVAQVVVVPYYLHLRSDGIMYLRVSPEREESVALAKELVVKMGEMLGGGKAPLLVRHEEFALPGKENREFWAKKESCPYSLADAFIVRSTALKLIANFYLRMNRPERPTRMFQQESEAIRWLKTFMPRVPPAAQQGAAFAK